jgi:nitroreductase
MDDRDTVRTVDAVIGSRRSIRSFLPDPVPPDVITEILDVAARAPSGVNAQPWKVHVLIGPALVVLTAAIIAVYDDPAASAEHAPDFNSYPEEWVAPYIDRRRKVGWDLYGLLGIRKGDTARMHVHRVIRAQLGIFESQMVVCGMALGRADPDAVENALQTLREPAAGFAVFHHAAPAQSGV